MSLKDCINKAVQDGIIPSSKQQDLIDDFDANYKKYLDQNMSERDAARLAGIDTFNEAKIKAAQKIKERTRTLKLQQEFEMQLDRYTDQTGKKDYGSVVKQKLMFTENKEGVNRIRSTEEEINLVQGRLDAIYSDVLKKFRHNLLGSNRNKATLVTMGREIFNPGSTGNKAAEELATAWIETAETARRMFNSAGGRIPKLEKWHLPQAHNELVVRDATYPVWRKFLIDNDILDLEQMVDYRTGKKMTEEQLELALTDVYNTISTSGYSKKTDIKMYNSKISKRRLDHRFLKFKDFDAWNTYNKKFGKGNVFDAMVGHIKNMSRDIAVMRTLSPDPDKFIEWMKETARSKLERDIKVTGKPFIKQKRKLKNDLTKVDDAYKTINGDFLDPANYMLAKSMAGLRDLTTAMYLGSASFMALGDFNLARITAQFTGLPATRIMFNNLKLFMQGFRQDKSALIKVAQSSGMVAEHWSTIASGMARVSADDIDRPEITRRVADFVLRSTGLSWLTQAGRWGVGTETMGFFAREAGNTWQQLQKKNPKFVQMLEVNNITESDWNIIRRIPVYDAGVDDSLNKGAKFIRPADIFKMDDLTEEQAMDVFAKYQSAINYVIDFAVPTAKLKGSIAFGGTRAGTVPGEFMRSVLQFKQFPLTLMFTHLTRMLGRKSNGRKLSYFADLIVSTTIMGALAYELKQITKGKEPTDLSELDEDQRNKYFLNNLIRGGGLGFMGDFLFSTKYGGASGGIGTFAGAVPMLGFEIIDFAVGNVSRKFEGKEQNYAGDMNDLIKKNFPGGSVWYGRLALERWLFDNIAEMVDKKYYEKRKRLKKRVYKEEGTEFFWSPGDNLPKDYPF
jgi:type 1 glutamine amidotransferase